MSSTCKVRGRASSRLRDGYGRVMLLVEGLENCGMWKHVMRRKGLEASSENNSRTVWNRSKVGD